MTNSRVSERCHRRES